MPITLRAGTSVPILGLNLPPACNDAFSKSTNVKSSATYDIPTRRRNSDVFREHPLAYTVSTSNRIFGLPTSTMRRYWTFAGGGESNYPIISPFTDGRQRPVGGVEVNVTSPRNANGRPWRCRAEDELALYLLDPWGFYLFRSISSAASGGEGSHGRSDSSTRTVAGQAYVFGSRQSRGGKSCQRRFFAKRTQSSPRIQSRELVRSLSAVSIGEPGAAGRP
jgi:hypothetical protein